MAKQKKKYIPPCDVVGKRVSWKKNNQDRMWGEVTRVFFKMIPDVRFPGTNMRSLQKWMTVEMADGRSFTMLAEHEELKRINMVPEGYV